MLFETFVFKDGYKLCIFEDGKIKLYKNDLEINNNKLIKELIERINKEDITLVNTFIEERLNKKYD